MGMLRGFRTASPALALLLVILAVACSPSPEDEAAPTGGEPAATTPAEADATVTIQDRAFSVDEITVAAGDTVAWLNEDNAGHTVTNGEGGSPAVGALFDVPVSDGQAATFTFEEAGTYQVTCRIHHQMQMTVIVEEAPGS